MFYHVIPDTSLSFPSSKDQYRIYINTYKAVILFHLSFSDLLFCVGAYGIISIVSKVTSSEGMTYLPDHFSWLSFLLLSNK